MVGNASENQTPFWFFHVGHFVRKNCKEIHGSVENEHSHLSWFLNKKITHFIFQHNEIYLVEFCQG